MSNSASRNPLSFSQGSEANPESHLSLGSSLSYLNNPTFVPNQPTPLAYNPSTTNPYDLVFNYDPNFSQTLAPSFPNPDNQFGLYQNLNFTTIDSPPNAVEANNFGRPSDTMLQNNYNYNLLPYSVPGPSPVSADYLASQSNVAAPNSSKSNNTSSVVKDISTSNPPAPNDIEPIVNHKPKKVTKRKKTSKACVYCRRSHMTCNEERPCYRCLTRHIGHLCHDNESPGDSSTNISVPETASYCSQPTILKAPSSKELFNKETQQITVHVLNNLDPNVQFPLTRLPRSFGSKLMDNEYNIISQFLKSLDETSEAKAPFNETELFLMTAADQHDGTFEERLREIITAKYHAGLLKPYNYVNGYSRLQTFLETHVSATNRQRILYSISTFRPKFRQIAKTLTDIDLVLVEEGFERLLLDYDRVFSAMGIPACLWRRTGEIFKANKEFASLIGAPHDLLKEGKVCIYELMTEDSAVNYWDKYGNIAFDPKQKAMLSSCSLKDQHPNSQSSIVSCCFSFTIRRDKYNIPSAIVGNFLPSLTNNIN